MPRLITVQQKTPIIGDDVFLAHDVTIVGDVEIGSKSSVWFQCVIRGDVNSIRIGQEVNIQDGTIIHCTIDRSKTIIGDRVSVGHRALLHGCIIEDESLIGMGAIVMDNAIIETHCLIAAGAIVLENMRCKSGWVYAGVPAKPIKKIDAEDLSFRVIDTAKRYQEYSAWYSGDVNR